MIVYFVPWSMVNHHHPSILCKSKFWNGINFRSFSNEISGQHVPAIFFWYAQEPPVPERSVRLPWHPCIVYLPTLTRKISQMRVNVPCMDGMDMDQVSRLFFFVKSSCEQKIDQQMPEKGRFLLHGFEHDQWWDLCIFQLLHVFLSAVPSMYGIRTHICSCPPSFDPLIHQDILLTNGDLPSEDGLVKK